MKLRILDGSLRFRLSRPESQALGNGRTVTAAVRFPDGVFFHYRLVPKTDDSPIAAQFGANTIEVSLSHSVAARLLREKEVSLRGECPVDLDQTLLILIEKDFQCLAPRDEDESELFANPRADHNA